MSILKLRLKICVMSFVISWAMSFYTMFCDILIYSMASHDGCYYFISCLMEEKGILETYLIKDYIYRNIYTCTYMEYTLHT